MEEGHGGGGSFRPRYAIVVPVALLAGCGGITVVARAWNHCDVGINASANAIGLLFIVFPLLTVMHLVILVGGYRLAGRFAGPPGLRTGIAVAVVAVVALALVSWGFFAAAGLPLRNAMCPEGEPPWWPQWLPPPHDVYR